MRRCLFLENFKSARLTLFSLADFIAAENKDLYNVARTVRT